MSKRKNSTEDSTIDHSDVQTMSFEIAQSELQSIVERMELGDQELEQSLADFERGVLLMNRCHYVLKNAEQKVDVLVKDNNGLFTTEPFKERQD